MPKATACFSVKTLKAVMPTLLTLITIVVGLGLICIGYFIMAAIGWSGTGRELSQEDEHTLLWYGEVPCWSGIALLLGVVIYWVYRVVQNERRILQQEHQAQQATETNTPLNRD